SCLCELEQLTVGRRSYSLAVPRQAPRRLVFVSNPLNPDCSLATRICPAKDPFDKAGAGCKLESTDSPAAPPSAREFRIQTWRSRMSSTSSDRDYLYRLAMSAIARI